MKNNRVIFTILIIAGVLSIGTAYAVGATNIIFKTSDGVASHEIMRITGTGNVGIGTTTPQSKLDVNGGIVIGGTPQTGNWNTRVPIAKTINTLDNSGDVGESNSLTMEKNGLPVVSYWDVTLNSLDVIQCGDALCSAGNTKSIVDSGNVGSDNSIAIGSDGLPVISYLDYGNNHLKVAHCGDQKCSSGNAITTVDTNSSGFDTSIAIGSDGFPIISNSNSTLGSLKVVHCGDVSCSAGNTITLINPSGHGYSSSIMVGPEGLPIVAFSDGITTSLKAAHCTNLTCTANNIATVASGVGGTETSMTLGRDNEPIISFFDNAHIGTAHCHQNDCQAGYDIATFDTSTLGIGDTSIAIGSDGLPIVSYHDTNNNLKVLKCGDVTCANSQGIVNIVPSNSPEGTSTSIAIGSDGLPIIIYHEVQITGNTKIIAPTAGPLKIIHCGNMYCLPLLTRR